MPQNCLVSIGMASLNGGRRYEWLSARRTGNGFDVGRLFAALTRLGRFFRILLQKNFDSGM
jgi:hypothetical protein